MEPANPVNLQCPSVKQSPNSGLRLKKNVILPSYVLLKDTTSQPQLVAVTLVDGEVEERSETTTHQAVPVHQPQPTPRRHFAQNHQNGPQSSKVVVQERQRRESRSRG